MNVQDQIKKYITSQPANFRKVLNFSKVTLRMTGSDGGKTREFYQIGLSANTTGISVYIMGIKDKKY